MSKRQIKGRVAKALRDNGFESRDGKVFHKGSGMSVEVTKIDGKDVTTLTEDLVDCDELPRNVAQQGFGFDSTLEFLGEEFLTWLWFRIDTDGGEFTLPGNRVVGIAIDDMLQFAPKGDDDHEQTIRHGLPTRTAEARAGLRQGHRVAKAKLIVAEGSRQWTLVLDAARMSCCSVRLPEDAEECESPDDRTADRTGNWIALRDIVESLFGLFLKVRLAPGWMKGEAAAMAAWMRS